MKKAKETEHQQFIYINAMRDLAKLANISLPVVMAVIFVVMIAICIGNHNPSHTFTPRLLVILSFAILILVSAITFFRIRYYQKDIEHNYKQIRFLQDFYAATFILWMNFISVIIVEFSFTEIPISSFLLILTMIPVMCFINPIFWGVLEIIFIVITLSFEYTHGTEVDFLTAVAMLSLSLLAQNMVYRTKQNLYEQEYELMCSQEQEKQNAHIDNLTSLLNRRSYDEVVEKLGENELPEDLAYLFFDVNFLKKTNDTLGHKAGDELLIGAANVIEQAFSSYGQIFRTGGDEFVALLHMKKDEMEQAQIHFEKLMLDWRGKTRPNTLSIAMGYIFHADYPQLSLTDLEKTAEMKMYEVKKQYHRN